MGAVTRNEYRRAMMNLRDLPGLDVPLEPAGFLPQEQADDHNNQPPEKRLNGHRFTITASQ
jgi:hypothetical protein